MGQQSLQTGAQRGNRMNTFHRLDPASQAPMAAGPDEKPITLKQAFRALMFIGLHIAALAGGLLAVGLLGLVDFTAASLILAVLIGATTAAMVALYVHLIRRYGLSFGDLGFRRVAPRMFHLLWQVPAAIIASACIQGLALAAFGQLWDGYLRGRRC